MEEGIAYYQDLFTHNKQFVSIKKELLNQLEFYSKQLFSLRLELENVLAVVV